MVPSFVTPESSIGVPELVELPSGVKITRLPLTDLRFSSPIVAARIGHATPLPAGLRLPTTDELDELHALALHIEPVTLPTVAMCKAEGAYTEDAVQAFRVRMMRSPSWCMMHDIEVGARLAAAGWDGRQPIVNFGKHWTKDGGIYGWWRKDQRMIQVLSYAHKAEGHYTDYATTVHAVADGEGPMRKTIKEGDRGEDVKAAQRALGIVADGVFGPQTSRSAKAFQAARGLVADGIVGPKTWIAMGEKPAPATTAKGDPRAPACVAALRDANAAWPNRRKASDGIMGDAAHQARPSGHNAGNAVDITHDPENGCDAGVIAHQALDDARTQYVIWDGQIANVDIQDGTWRPYNGSNRHDKHCHIEIKPEMRDDASPWPWRP